MFIRQWQNSVMCFQANVLHVLYKHVSFSMCTKLKPQLHSEVLSSCGSSLVGVNVNKAAVAQVLGMSDLAKKTFGAYYNTLARGLGT